VGELDLSPRQFRTRFGGLFLFVPWLVSGGLETIVRRAGLPGSDMVPAGCALRSLLALKLFGNARHSHVMSHVLDEGLALFAGLNVVPKRSFRTESSCRIDPGCYPKLMQAWFDAAGRLGLAWRRIELEGVSRVYRTPRLLDQRISLPDYEGPIRHLVIADLGHEEPTLLLTNQLGRSPAKLNGQQPVSPAGQPDRTGLRDGQIAAPVPRLRGCDSHRDADGT